MTWTVGHSPEFPGDSFQCRDPRPPTPREGLEENNPEIPPRIPRRALLCRTQGPTNITFPGLPPAPCCPSRGPPEAHCPGQATEECFRGSSQVAQERKGLQEGQAARGKALTETARFRLSTRAPSPSAGPAASPERPPLRSRFLAVPHAAPREHLPPPGQGRF